MAGKPLRRAPSFDETETRDLFPSAKAPSQDRKRTQAGKKRTTLQLCPANGERFSRHLPTIRIVMERIISSFDADFRSPGKRDVKGLTMDIGEALFQEVRLQKLSFPRFKFVCHTVVLESVEQGAEDVLVAAGFLWHPEMGDSHCAIERKVGPFYISLAVYACYRD